MNNLFTASTAPSGKTFNDISCMDDIWEFTSNQLVDGLYWDTTNAGNFTNRSEYAMIYYENRLLGAPTMRSVKVRNDSCEVVEAFSREIKECFGGYTSSNEDRSTFGPYPPSPEFIYRTQQELETLPLWGTMATYGGGGFVLNMSINDPEETLADLNRIKALRWIGRGTRLVIIDFALYNANLNLFSVIKLKLELPPTGGVIPSSTFSVLRLIRYVTTGDYVVLVCEGIFCAFTIYFLLEEIIDFIKWKLKYFMQFWNIIDIIVLSLSLVGIWLSIRRTLLARRRINAVLHNQLTEAPFDDVLEAENIYNNISAILLFFVWIKVFKYISFNKTMSQLSATLSRSSKDIGGFAVMFFIFFFAYAQFGYLVFGTQISDYSTFYDAIFALFRTILGDFDFEALERANRVLGPTFFITYVFFVFFVLLNMFLAIINDTYVEVKQELARQSDNFEVATFFRKGWYRLLRTLRLTKEADDIHTSSIDFDAWRRALRKNGYTDEQIEEKFIKFEVESWHEMDEHKRDAMEEELEEDKREREKRAEHHKNISVMGRRMELMEKTILSVAGRVEDVVGRLKTVENEKVRTREHTNRLLAQKLLSRDDDQK